MKRNLVISILFLALMLLLTACGGSSNTSSGSTNTSTDTGSDSSTSTSTDTSASTNTAGSTGNAASIIGDWKYQGTVNGTTYEISLDLENSSNFDLNVDEESTDESVDSECEGTYVSDDTSITLSILTVEDTNSYFSGQVVQNEQVKLDYTLSDDGKTLTLTNASDAVAFLTEPLVLTKDMD